MTLGAWYKLHSQWTSTAKANLEHWHSAVYNQSTISVFKRQNMQKTKMP